MSILIIAAHPDDEVLGCGGTIARLSSEGAGVNIAILGEGMTSRNNIQAEQVAALQSAASHAAAMLGAKELWTGGLPDNCFDTVPLLDVAKIIEYLLERFQPHVVYTHWDGDLNIDHAITHRAVLTATRPMTDCSVKELYAFEVPSSTEWAFGNTFSPDTYVNIGNTLKRKINAMQLYESELRDYPHPRSLEALKALATWRGATAGFLAAEAFQTIRRTI